VLVEALRAVRPRLQQHSECVRVPPASPSGSARRSEANTARA
jgi:hypothetical protein